MSKYFKFPCVYACLSYCDLFNFWYEFSLPSPLFHLYTLGRIHPSGLLTLNCSPVRSPSYLSLLLSIPPLWKNYKGSLTCLSDIFNLSFTYLFMGIYFTIIIPFCTYRTLVIHIFPCLLVFTFSIPLEKFKCFILLCITKKHSYWGFTNNIFYPVYYIYNPRQLSLFSYLSLLTIYDSPEWKYQFAINYDPLTTFSPLNMRHISIYNFF